MPSIHAIVTRGYGTFAGVTDIPTRGFGTGAVPPVIVTAEVGGAGNWRLDRPKRTRRIRFSDFETRDAFEAALREELLVVPMAAVSDATILRDAADEDDEDEDDMILMAVSRFLQ